MSNGPARSGVGDGVRLQHRPGSIGGQRIPGICVQNPGDGQVIILLESSDGASVIVAVHAVRRAELKLPLLDMIMPNGKAMCDCTGAEMGEFGQQMSRTGKEMEAAERL